MVNQKAEDHVQGVQKLSSGSSLGTSSKQTAAAVHEAAQHSHAVSGQSRQGAMPSSPNVHAQDVNAREAVSLPVVQATGQLRDREHASTSAASSFKDGASHTSEGSAAGCSSKPERNNLDLNFILQGGTHPDVPLWMQPDSVAFMHGEVILTSLPPTILESRKTRKALASAQGQLGAEMDQALQYAGGRGDSYRLHTHDTRSHSNFQQQGADLSSEHAGSAPQAMGRHEGDARWPSEAQAQQPVDSSHVLSAAQHARLQSDHLLRLIQNVRPYKVYTHQACRAVAKAAGKLSLAISSLEINPRGTGTHLKAALPIADRVFTELVNSKAYAPGKEVFAEEYGSAVHAMLVSVRLALSGFTSFTKVAHLQLPAAETAELLQTHIALVQLRARVDDEWAATVAALCKPARAGRLGVMHGMLSPEDARLKASTDLLAKCLKFELLSGPSTALPQAALLNHLCQQARQELHLAQSIHVESSSRPRIHFDDDQQAAGLTQQVRSVLDACLGCASGLLLQPRADRAALLNNAVQLSERLGGISAQARARCLHSLHAMAQQIAGSQQQKGSTQQGHSSALVRAANALWDVAAAVQTLGAYDSLLYSTAAEASMQMLRSFHKKVRPRLECHHIVQPCSASQGHRLSIS